MPSDEAGELSGGNHAICGWLSSSEAPTTSALERLERWPPRRGLRSPRSALKPRRHAQRRACGLPGHASPPFVRWTGAPQSLIPHLLGQPAARLGAQWGHNLFVGRPAQLGEVRATTKCGFRYRRAKPGAETPSAETPRCPSILSAATLRIDPVSAGDQGRWPRAPFIVVHRRSSASVGASDRIRTRDILITRSVTGRSRASIRRHSSATSTPQ